MFWTYLAFCYSLFVTLRHSRIPASIFRCGGSGDVGDDGGHLVSLCVVGAADTCPLRYSITKPLGQVMVKVSPRYSITQPTGGVSVCCILSPLRNVPQHCVVEHCLYANVPCVVFSYQQHPHTIPSIPYTHIPHALPSTHTPLLRSLL